VKRPGRLVPVVVAVLSLLLAAVALAATPSKGTYRGKTSQARNVHIKINSKHNIPGGGFVINWQAPCQVKTDHVWGPERTENSSKIVVKDDGSFRLDGKYNSHVGDYVGHISIKNGGRFNTKTSATGTFKVTVRVTKNGDYADTCKKTVTWSVSA
jgi:hypothetical protein